MIQEDEGDEDGNFVIDQSLHIETEMTEIEDDRAHWDTEIPKMPARWGNTSPGASPAKRGVWDVPQSEASTSTHILRSPAAVSPVKAYNPTSPLAKSPSRRKRHKPDSSVGASASDTNVDDSNVSNVQHTLCPICGKELHVDNAGLNAHVDYCLSRGTIRTMQAAAAAHDDDHTDGLQHVDHIEKTGSGNDRLAEKKSGRIPGRLYDFGVYRKPGS
jgi:DNA polymerase kappa